MNSVRDTEELAWKLFLESGTTGNGSIDYVDLRTFEGESVARLPAGTGETRLRPAGAVLNRAGNAILKGVLIRPRLSGNPGNFTLY